MLAWEEWCRFGLRRPFSRRLVPTTGAIIEPQARRNFVHGLGDVRPDNALAASLVFLGHVFGGEHREARDLLSGMSRSDLAEHYASLFARTDLRKFLLACFRDHYHAHGMLSPEMAALLEAFLRTFDYKATTLVPLAVSQPGFFSKLLEGTGTAAEAIPLMAFDKVTTLPRTFRITLLCKKYYYDDRSRLHDLGPRLSSAFEQSGINCRVVDPRYEEHDFAPADLVLVDARDLHGQVFKKDRRKKESFVERLRASTPRLALFDFDPWATSFADELTAAGQSYDFVWTLAPGLVRNGKINDVPACVVPFPVGFPELFAEARARPLSSAAAPIRFCGGVEEYNSSRLLWLLSRHRFRAPFHYEVTSHADDRQSVTESLRSYLARLTAATACLNFTRRANGQSMVVGRSFDALCAGRVLVEEISDDIRHYLAPDDHFLTFRTVAELEDICARLSWGGRAGEIARRGNEYFNAHYSDEAISRHLLTFV